MGMLQAPATQRCFSRPANAPSAWIAPSHNFRRVVIRRLVSCAANSSSNQREIAALHTAVDAYSGASQQVLSAFGLLTGIVTACTQLAFSAPALALLNSPNAQIPRTVDAALRRSIPAFNPNVASIQRNMEDVAYFLRIPQRKPWVDMLNRVTTALELVDQPFQILEGVPVEKEEEATALLADMRVKLKELELAIATQQPDAVSIRVASVLKYVSNLELLQAPGLSFIVPKEYSNLPRLIGRAVVDITVETKDGSAAFLDDKAGGLKKQGTIQLTLDGYSAPITAGNFMVNVLEGLYDGRSLSSSYNSLIIGGSPITAKAPVPLEILPAGEFDPIYRTPLDVQNGELPVLPLSISGSVSMTHLPNTDSFLSGDEWFVYKFDKQQSGLAGLAFDEGTFGVFGYVTKGMDVVNKLKSGDIVVSAKVVQGADKLIIQSRKD